MAPRTCGAEPSKSTIMRSPVTVMVTAIGIGSGSRPSSSMWSVKE